MKLAELFRPGQPERLRLARQSGINHAIVRVIDVLSGIGRRQYLDALASIKAEFNTAGLIVAGVESHPVPAEKIKLGLPGRDEEIENYLAVIEALAEVGIPMICYNWMAGLGWYRTRTDVAERGGALVSAFDNDAANRLGLTEWGVVSEEVIWTNLDYFLKSVIPVAERVGIQMALHPDDPPVSPLRGIGRILTSAANHRRVLDMVPSSMNGVTFCQATFKAMGEDVESLAKEWLGQHKVFFVHYRDIVGTRDHFREAFHDTGSTDMVRMLEVYDGYGFTGPIRPDHAPTMEGESNESPGYGMIGKVFAMGYMIGIMQARGIPYE